MGLKTWLGLRKSPNAVEVSKRWPAISAEDQSEPIVTLGIPLKSARSAWLASVLVVVAEAIRALGKAYALDADHLRPVGGLHRLSGLDVHVGAGFHSRSGRERHLVGRLLCRSPAVVGLCPGSNSVREAELWV